MSGRDNLNQSQPLDKILYAVLLKRRERDRLLLEPGRVIARDLYEAMAIAKDSWSNWYEIADVREVPINSEEYERFAGLK